MEFPRKSALLLALGLSSTSVLADLQPYRAEYSASMAGIPVSGDASRSFSLLEGGQYHLESKADLVLVSMRTTSQGLLKDPLQPQHYSYKQGGFGKKRSRSAQFDWDQQQVNSHKNDRSWELPLKTGTFDELSYQAQLRRDLSEGKQELSYLVVDDDELDLFRFERQGEENLETPLGNIKTLRVKRMRDNNKRVTEIWFAPSLGYVPVQLRQLEKGKEYRLEIQTLNLNGKTVTKTKLQGALRCVFCTPCCG